MDKEPYDKYGKEEILVDTNDSPYWVPGVQWKPKEQKKDSEEKEDEHD